MKAVLMSVQPRWCTPITRLEKTWEIRKTKPKLDTPFKCYIYETGGLFLKWRRDDLTPPIEYYDHGKKKVISEFVCDDLICLQAGIDDVGEKHLYNTAFLDKIGLTDQELFDYLYDGKKNTGWGWHISDLKVYDKPKELTKFRRPCIMPECPYCPECEVGYEYISETEAEFLRVDGECSTEWVCLNTIKRPPQSWCYVEELEADP